MAKSSRAKAKKAARMDWDDPLPAKGKGSNSIQQIQIAAVPADFMFGEAPPQKPKGQPPKGVNPEGIVRSTKDAQSAYNVPGGTSKPAVSHELHDSVCERSEASRRQIAGYTGYDPMKPGGQAAKAAPEPQDAEFLWGSPGYTASKASLPEAPKGGVQSTLYKDTAKIPKGDTQSNVQSTYEDPKNTLESQLLTSPRGEYCTPGGEYKPTPPKPPEGDRKPKRLGLKLAAPKVTADPRVRDAVASINSYADSYGYADYATAKAEILGASSKKAYTAFDSSPTTVGSKAGNTRLADTLRAAQIDRALLHVALTLKGKSIDDYPTPADVPTALSGGIKLSSIPKEYAGMHKDDALLAMAEEHSHWLARDLLYAIPDFTGYWPNDLEVEMIRTAPQVLGELLSLTVQSTSGRGLTAQSIGSLGGIADELHRQRELELTDQIGFAKADLLRKNLEETSLPWWARLTPRVRTWLPHRPEGLDWRKYLETLEKCGPKAHPHTDSWIQSIWIPSLAAQAIFFLEVHTRKRSKQFKSPIKGYSELHKLLAANFDEIDWEPRDGQIQPPTGEGLKGLFGGVYDNMVDASSTLSAMPDGSLPLPQHKFFGGLLGSLFEAFSACAEHAPGLISESCGGAEALCLQKQAPAWLAWWGSLRDDAQVAASHAAKALTEGKTEMFHTFRGKYIELVESYMIVFAELSLLLIAALSGWEDTALASAEMAHLAPIPTKIEKLDEDTLRMMSAYAELTSAESESVFSQLDPTVYQFSIKRYQ